MEDDFVLCRVCKLNYTTKEWAKHRWSNKHKDNLERVLEREKTLFTPYFQPTSNDSPSVDDFYCFFCDVNPSVQYGTPTTPSLVWKHIAGGSHTRKINKFWTEYGANPAWKRLFHMTKPHLKNCLRGLSEAPEEPEPINIIVAPSISDIQPKPPFPSSLLSSVEPSSFQADSPRIDEDFVEPRVLQPRTITSKLGILQNSIGLHEGRRVWGGGIIKIPAKDWIPWPIDLDVDENIEGETFMGAASVRTYGHQPSGKKQPIAKRTSSASAPNLRSLSRSNQNNKPNVFTPGSLPPWVKPIEAKLFPELTMALVEAREEAKERKKNPNRVGAAWAEQKRRMDKMQEVTQTPKNWLPNFGRVFNTSRSSTANEYRAEKFELQKYTSDKKRNLPADPTPQ